MNYGMDAQTLAEKLNFCKYRNEISKELEEEAKKHGLVVVFGSSDDLIEFRGAIDDEVGAFEGGSALVTENGLLESKCDEGDDCPYFKKEINKAKEINAIWCPLNEHDEVIASWLITTDIHHHTFDVMEDYGEMYCRGIVFSLEDCRVSENEKSKL